MRYIRMYMGGEDGSPGLTLYEIDDNGWVHRQVQVHAEGTRFSPEDILMRRPVNTDFMARHPAAEEIDAGEFALLWAEVSESRGFCRRIPDACLPWQGWLETHGGDCWELRWDPQGHPGPGYAPVPGFSRLFVAGEPEQAWRVQIEVFLERGIHWRAKSLPVRPAGAGLLEVA